MSSLTEARPLKLPRAKWLSIAAAIAAVTLSLLACSTVQVSRARAERRYLGDTLYVQRSGTGPPVVLLAGLMGSTRYWKSAHFETVAGQHSLLFIDALGFGRSPWPDGDYTLEEHLSALRRTLVREGAASHVTFVAHSFGTILATNYVARYPDEVDHLYLLGAPVFRDATEARQRMAGMSFVARLFSRSRWLAWGACMLQDALQPLARRLAPVIGRDVPAEVAGDATLHFWSSLDGTVRNVILSKPIEQPLADVGGKVTFVHGQRDRVTPLSRIREVAQRFGAGLIVVSGGHGDYVGSGTNAVIQRLATPRALQLGISSDLTPAVNRGRSREFGVRPLNFIGVTTLLFATATMAGTDHIFMSYEEARQALIKGSIADVQKAAKHIAVSAHSADQHKISEKAAALEKAKDLKAARLAFATLSDEVIKYRETRCCERPAVTYCSMEKKSWLQPAGEIGNPYVEASMRKCGEIKSPAKQTSSQGRGHVH